MFRVVTADRATARLKGLTIPYAGATVLSARVPAAACSATDSFPLRVAAIPRNYSPLGPPGCQRAVGTKEPNHGTTGLILVTESGFDAGTA
jgi:hypothetical protein